MAGLLCAPEQGEQGAPTAVERGLASSLQPFLLDPEPVILTSWLYLLWGLNQFSRLSTCFQLPPDTLRTSYAYCLQNRLPSLAFKAVHNPHPIYLPPHTLSPPNQPCPGKGAYPSSALIWLQEPAFFLQTYSSPKTHLKLPPLVEPENMSAWHFIYAVLALSNFL